MGMLLERPSSAADLSETARLLGVEPQHLIAGLDLVRAAKLLGIASWTLRQLRQAIAHNTEDMK